MQIKSGQKVKIIEHEILQYSYWEHFKLAKELSLIFPPEHFKRIELQSVMDELLSKINAV